MYLIKFLGFIAVHADCNMCRSWVKLGYHDSKWKYLFENVGINSVVRNNVVIDLIYEIYFDYVLQNVF